jgi:rhamnogalacturonyl hydrolase YesR
MERTRIMSKKIQWFTPYVTLCFLVLTCHGNNSFGKQVTSWSVELAKTIMSRYPDPDDYPYRSWCYPQGYMLQGMAKLWNSTGERKYYDYIMKYVNEHVDDQGRISRFRGNSMDDMMAGSIIVWAYQQTSLEKYKLAAEQIRKKFDDYPRTSDGLFWHGRGTVGQVWVDGVFMGQMFLTKYGKYIGDSDYCFNEAAKQLTLISQHLKKGDSGLLLHAWDEDKDASWADPNTGLSPEVWSEGLGWYALIMVETLEIFPEDHPKRAELADILKNLLRGLKETQDSNTGLWYQVVDKGNLPDNWHDTSGSGMFLYCIQKSIELGLADPKVYGPVVEKAYHGLITNAVIGDDGLIDIHNACDGLGVQVSYDAYINYKKKVNAEEAVASFLWGTWIVEKPTRSGIDSKPSSNRILPRVFLLDPETLIKVKIQLKAADKKLSPALEELRRQANQALQRGPFSVMDKSATAPSGDKHDYLSMGPYWWPNPDTADGLPYVRRDGYYNPQREQFDINGLRAMEESVYTLSLAYYFTEEKKYAAHAAKLIKVWFLDEATRMNPNLEYGQFIPGIAQGRGIGIIESRRFIQVGEAVGMLAGSVAWTEQDQAQLQTWYDQYLTWMLESQNGRDEAAEKNNHGSWYDVQSAYYALFVGKENFAKEILKNLPQKRIAVQIEPDGRQLLELKRTKAFGYSLFNLDALFAAATLSDRFGMDIWNYSTQDSRSIQKALDFLIPYAMKEKEWPYQQISGWSGYGVRMMVLLRQANIHFHDGRYEQLIYKLAEEVPISHRVNLLYPE